MSGAPGIAYSPIVDRPAISWPDNARVALWVALNIEHYQYRPSPNTFITAWPRLPEPPDVMHYSYYDFGNRIGFWRMLEVLDHYRVRTTASCNVAVLEHFPEVREALVERDWDVMSHGIYNTHYLFGMNEDEERAFLRHTKDIVRRHTGKQLKGMIGPAGSVTVNTMRIMAEEGFLYSADWLIDDQPFPIDAGPEKFVGIPYSSELNDDALMGLGYDSGGYEADYFAQICRDQFDVLYEEGATSGRVMCLGLHTYVFGHPHRIAYLAEVFDYILSHEGVWMATADEIAEHFIEHSYDDVRKHIARSMENR